MLEELIPRLPHLNASLNALATCLLVLGFVLIKRRNETAHKWTMLSCFAVSVVFLGFYLLYHFNTEIVRRLAEDAPTAMRYLYYAILISHIILAALVPFLAILTIYLGLRNRRESHRRWARWTFPIWLYVSVTGVLVYVFLYWLYPIS